MSRHASFKRYMLITERTNHGHFPTLQEIVDYLVSHGFEVSTRTVQRDIEYIRDTFEVAIQYDRYEKGYFINRDESINLDVYFRFLDVVRTTDVVSESVRKNRETLRCISFEGAGSFRGTDYLRDILFAVLNRRVIKIAHQKFQAKNVKTYSVHPLFLKEYQNRWYVVGTLLNNSFLSYLV